MPSPKTDCAVLPECRFSFSRIPIPLSLRQYKMNFRVSVPSASVRVSLMERWYNCWINVTCCSPIPADSGGRLRYWANPFWSYGENRTSRRRGTGNAVLVGTNPDKILPVERCLNDASFYEQFSRVSSPYGDKLLPHPSNDSVLFRIR